MANFLMVPITRLFTLFGQSVPYSKTPPNCQHSFFGLVPWYGYLNFKPDSNSTCGYSISMNQAGDPSLWVVALAIFDDLLRVAGMVAIGFVIYGGIRYMTSQGEPEATKAAQGTIINALIGLAIAAIGAATVSYIASNL